MTIAEDLKRRSQEIVWPKGFTPADADVFAHNELRIEAPAEKVWERLLDVQSWPSWYSNAKNIRMMDGVAEGVLALGTVFQWETFGNIYQCQVCEVVSPTRIAWKGWPLGSEPTNYHAWLIKPDEHGCHIVTEEVGKGEGAKKVRDTDEGLFHRGHNLWLAALRFATEGRTA